MKLPYILAIAAALALTGCAVPIPPTGPDAGRYGWLNIGYTPNALTFPNLTTNQPTTKGYTK